MEESCRDLSSLLVNSPSTLVNFDVAVQDHLTRNDEIMALVDSARLEIQHTTDVAFANLLVQTKVSFPPNISSAWSKKIDTNPCTLRL
jgi:hypothetical protein